MNTFGSGRSAAVALALIAVAAAVLVLLVRGQLRETADVARLQAVRTMLKQVPMPAHDNDPARDAFDVDAGMRASGIDELYLARQAGRLVGVYAVVSIQGYADKVELLVGADTDGRITGVQLLEQHETEGYGGRLANEDRDWLQVLHGRRLAGSGDPAWRLRRDGGEVDAISGATITSRNILSGVREVLDAISRAELARPDPPSPVAGDRAARQ